MVAISRKIIAHLASASGMEALIGLLTIAGLLVLTASFSKRQHAHRSPFQSAFGATVLAALFLVTGIFGLRLDKNDYAFVHVTQTGTMRWSEVLTGAVLSGFAVYFWRKALRTLA